MFCRNSLFVLCTVGSLLYVLVGSAVAEPRPDVVGDILGQLVALGLPVNEIDLGLSVCSCTLISLR